jgi:hypothetical protein
MADEEVWVQLYTGNGKNGRVFSIPFANLGGKKRIQELATAVYQAKDKSLGHCNAADLFVYKAGTGVPESKDVPLNSWDGVPKDTTGPDPLRVVAPEQQQGKNFMVLSFLPDYTCSMHT